MERIVSLSSLDTYLLKAPQRQKVIIADSNTSELCLSVLIYNMESLIDAQIIEIEAAQFLPRKPKQQVREYNIGRNDQCPCGSGKKYKKCCLESGKYEGFVDAV
jgi:preprotein translocase subunit SecA